MYIESNESETEKTDLKWDSIELKDSSMPNNSKKNSIQTREHSQKSKTQTQALPKLSIKEHKSESSIQLH